MRCKDILALTFEGIAILHVYARPRTKNFTSFLSFGYEIC